MSDLWREEKIRLKKKKNGWDVFFEGGRIGERMVVINELKMGNY